MNGMKTVTRKILAGVASMATLLTGAAFAVSANAVPATTYTSNDQFEAGPLKDSKPAQLTVAKYLTNTWSANFNRFCTGCNCWCKAWRGRHVYSYQD